MTDVRLPRHPEIAIPRHLQDKLAALDENQRDQAFRLFDAVLDVILTWPMRPSLGSAFEVLEAIVDTMQPPKGAAAHAGRRH